MKTSTFILLLAAALTLGMPASDSLAQEGNTASAKAAPQISPHLPAGTVARYRVTYARSDTSVTALRTASIVSVTNQSTVSCTVAVDWKFVLAGVVCGTSIVVAPGNSVDFCTRPIPGSITNCNSTCSPALTFNELSATVGSATTTGCEKIAVSARTVYTASTTDSPISAITDAKVVRFNAANIGD